MARPNAVTLVLCGAVLSCFVAWSFLSSSQPTDTGTSIASAAAVEVPLLSEAASATQVEAMAEPMARPTAGAGDVVDLCGIGRMPLPVGTPIDAPPVWQDLPTPLGTLAMAAAQAQVMARLAAGSERQRAAALLLQHYQSEDAGERTDLAVKLTAIERSARDPAISAWAMATCDASPTACDADTARRWTELEPDNAAAWMALARHQPTEPDEVDRGMAQSTQHNVHLGALAAAVRKAWPEGEAPYLQLPVLLQGIGVDGAATRALLQPTVGYCRSPPPDSARAAGCAALAEAMVQRGDTVMSHKLGIAIGERLGWPAERLSALNAELKALIAGLSAFDDRQPYACQNIERVRGWIDAVDQAGEKASARAAQQAPG